MLIGFCLHGILPVNWLELWKRAIETSNSIRGKQINMGAQCGNTDSSPDDNLKHFCRSLEGNILHVLPFLKFSCRISITPFPPPTLLMISLKCMASFLELLHIQREYSEYMQCVFYVPGSKADHLILNKQPEACLHASVFRTCTLGKSQSSVALVAAPQIVFGYISDYNLRVIQSTSVF